MKVQKFEYLENKRSFICKIWSIFHSFLSSFLVKHIKIDDTNFENMLTWKTVATSFCRFNLWWSCRLNVKRITCFSQDFCSKKYLENQRNFNYVKSVTHFDQICDVDTLAGIYPSILTNVCFGEEGWVLQGQKWLQSDCFCSLGSGAELWWFSRGKGLNIFDFSMSLRRLNSLQWH